MIKKLILASSICFLFLLQSLEPCAQDTQDKRTQYPRFLSDHVYFGANAGSINYSFSGLQVELPYHTGYVHVSHTAVRLILFGYRFNNYLSAQVSYMRPVNWLKFVNIDGDNVGHSVPMNITGITIKANTKATKKFLVYGEAGFCIVTRTGFKFGDNAVVRSEQYIGLLSGAGLQYHPSRNWNFIAAATFTPSYSKAKQPSTVFFSGGVTYNMNRLSAERVEKNRHSGYIFPENLLQFGFSTNSLGYGVNDFFSNKILPIFWGGVVEVKQGFSIHYQRNIFHGRKAFALDWGASYSYWKTNINDDNFYTLSVFPVFRFIVFHFKPADLYFNYSVAGPTYISKIILDETTTGKHFTFQDFMGMGFFAGRHRTINGEVRIGHYSNGDLFTQNNGVKIPLTFNLGYTF